MNFFDGLVTIYYDKDDAHGNNYIAMNYTQKRVSLWFASVEALLDLDPIHDSYPFDEPNNIRENFTITQYRYNNQLITFMELKDQHPEYFI